MKQSEWAPEVPEQPSWLAELLRLPQKLARKPFSALVHVLHFSVEIWLNLIGFVIMCINYNQIKNAKKSESQKANWSTSNLAQVIISACASCLVSQYRCCCKSCRWWHILILASGCCGCYTIFVNISILSIFSIASSRAAISSSSNSNSRAKVATGPAEVLSGLLQLCQPAGGCS